MKKVEQVEVEYVKKTTTLVVAVVCLAVGIVIGLIYSKLSQPAGEVRQSSAPAPAAQPQPRQQATPGPAAVPHDPQKEAEILRLKQILGTDPKNAEALARLGHNYFDLNQYDNAIDAYRKYLDLNPNNPNVWTDMGVMYRRTRRPDEAIRCFDKAIAADPKHQQSRFNKGVVLMFDFRKNEEALNTWRDLLKMNPNAKAPDGTPISRIIEQYSKTPKK
jgi:cytochrome c-type biogenesis protein CcmH/NrfG